MKETKKKKKKTNGQGKQKVQNKMSEMNPNISVITVSTNGLKAVEDKQ